MTAHGTRVISIEELWPEGRSSPGWSHSGVAVCPDGAVVFAHPEGERLVFHHPVSGVTRLEPTGLLELHGITQDPFDDTALWLADPGEKPVPAAAYEPETRAGRVVRWRRGAGIVQEITPPAVAGSGRPGWKPTAVSVDSGGSVWVADGYGAGLVHRFTRTGDHLLTIDGSESGTPFDCPHGVLATRSTSTGAEEISVADRGNRRIVVYRPDGGLVRVLTSPRMTSPSCLAEHDGVVFVTDLFGGLLRIDEGSVVGAVFDGPDAPTGEDWPNARVDGRLAAPHLDPRALHSPHGIAVDADGVLSLTEWCIGGRQLRVVIADD